ncbi:MAG: glycosyltransferase family 4 protein [Planctomycetota bacterium]
MSPPFLLVSGQVRSVHSGVGTYARLLLEGLSARGLRPSVATWTEELDPQGLGDLHWIDLGPRPGLDPTQDSFWTLGRRLTRRFGSLGPDFGLVHFLDARQAHAFERPAGARGLRLVGTVHDDYAARCPRWPWELWGRAADPLRRWLYYRWLARLERRTYAGLDRLLVNSRATGRCLAEVYGTDPGRMLPAELCVGPARVRAEARRLDGEPALLFAGGNWYRKGLDLVVQALPLVAARRPGVVLHVAGEDRAAGKLRALAERLGVADRIQWLGRLRPERMALAFAGADAFVMPSRTEALGLVYLEAFRARLPVIASTEGEVVELVQDRRSGLLVPTEDVRALARAILELDGDEALRRRCVEGGLEVHACRSPARMLAATLEAYGAPWSGPASPDQTASDVSKSPAGSRSAAGTSSTEGGSAAAGVDVGDGSPQSSPETAASPPTSRAPIARGEKRSS